LLFQAEEVGRNSGEKMEGRTGVKDNDTKEIIHRDISTGFSISI
jgi:hypothetical protein